MARSSWSPSPSPSPSSSSSSSSNSQNRSPRYDKIPAKCLVEEIPLVPPPIIDCKNLSLLDDTEFVNVVYESESPDNACFRISDANNKEVCRIIRCHQADCQPAKKGVKYLECQDLQGKCVLYVAYPVGLGEVALLSPSEQLIGECQSNVEFICLSVKVKYNFFDANGNRLMKMTAIMPEEGSGEKFMLMVKRSKKEKLALIKMGSLKSCCQIKFKVGHVSVLERLQIIALWAGFMHNEIQNSETPILIEKRAQVKAQEKESRRSKSFYSKISQTFQSDSTRASNSVSSPPSDTNSEAERQNSPSTIKNDNENVESNNTPVKPKPLKNLVESASRLFQQPRGNGGHDLKDNHRSAQNNNCVNNANNNNNINGDDNSNKYQNNTTGRRNIKIPINSS